MSKLNFWTSTKAHLVTDSLLQELVANPPPDRDAGDLEVCNQVIGGGTFTIYVDAADAYAIVRRERDGRLIVVGSAAKPMSPYGDRSMGVAEADSSTTLNLES